MREQLYSELLCRLNDVASDKMDEIQKILVDVLDSYEIQRRCTDLVPVGYLPECVKVYLVTKKIEGLSKLTLDMYKQRIEKFFDMTQKRMEIITPNDIRIFLYRYQEQTKCSDRSLDSVRSCLSAFFKWASSEGYIAVNPCANIKPIKYTENPRGFLADIEVEMLRCACSNLRDQLMIELLYSTGCRVSELVNIKKSDVDIDKGEVIIFGKGSKYRKAYLNSKSKILIKSYLEKRSDDCEYLIVSDRKPIHQLTRRFIETKCKDLGEASGIKQRVYPHLIRHTSATLGLQRGMDITEVQKMLGHEKIDTTLIYAKVSDESVKTSHKKFII